MTEHDAAALMSALANPDRLKLLRFLVVAGPSGAPAGAIAIHLGASPPRASFHLKTLTEAGILTVERSGRTLTHRVDFTRLGALLGWLVEDCCGGDAHLRQCCAPR